MCDKLCAVIHDGLDGQKCNTRGRLRRFLLTTSLHHGTDIAHPKNGHFPLDIRV